MAKQGPSYASNLIVLFLLHRCEPVHSVSFHIIDIILRNLHQLPWTPQLAEYLRVNVLETHTFLTGSEIQALENRVRRLVTC
ncbi:hypothetical protein GDO86_018098 [Hymenochirus boettgeri]|uniref:Uncharacterized protein n=1 Tax=Hymenochirus boettgeri TaxID=247094 RepID=A0A8T2IDM8_9PIPI|nr:hypothetical protein GDO86_018098 [Hymenochirus boettgeri]